MPLVNIVSGSIDTIIGGRDALNSENLGQSVGNGLTTVGSILLVAGGYSSITGGGALVCAIGLGLQSAGAWVVSNFSTASLFLQYCSWGKPSILSSIASGGALEDYGYYGDLSDLKNPPSTAQHKVLDYLLFKFKPDLKVERVGNKSALVLNMGVPEKALSSISRWYVNVVIKPSDVNKSHEINFKPGVDPTQADSTFSHINFSANEYWIIEYIDDPEFEADLFIELDVFGDGKHKIECKLYLDNRSN
jgi:hypothetical protein